MKISIIAAIAENRVIGKDNNLPWRLAADLKKFKELTSGHHIIMGRKTFESIGRPLPNRTSVIITRNKNYKAEGCLVAHSLSEAISLSKEDEEVFIIGGAQIFEIAISLADKMYLSWVAAEPDGEILFPKFNEDEWAIAHSDHFLKDSNNEYNFTFKIYERKE